MKNIADGEMDIFASDATVPDLRTTGNSKFSVIVQDLAMTYVFKDFHRETALDHGMRNVFRERFREIVQDREMMIDLGGD